MQLSPHLNFNGNCEAAFSFYEKSLSAKITFMMPYEGSPAAEQVAAGDILGRTIWYAHRSVRHPVDDQLRQSRLALWRSQCEE
jgi:uncharacterized glyoxalase superfamily protein PhnB